MPENIDAKLNLSASIMLGDLEMARDFASFWKDGSEQDTSLFKVRYKYAGNPKPEREFCQKVMKAGKVYRKEKNYTEQKVIAEYLNKTFDEIIQEIGLDEFSI